MVMGFWKCEKDSRMRNGIHVRNRAVAGRNENERMTEDVTSLGVIV